MLITNKSLIEIYKLRKMKLPNCPVLQFYKRLEKNTKAKFA